MNLNALIEGFIVGIGTVIFIGPVFFSLIQITLQKGKVAGFSVALGIIASDVLIVGLFYFGLLKFFQNAEVQFWMAVLGSIILLMLGLKYIFKPYSPSTESSTLGQGNNSTAFVQGFLVNFVNPFVFVVWMSIITLAESRFDSKINVGVFLFAVLLGIFCIDILKVFLSNKLQKILNPMFLKKVFFAIGIVLIGFFFRLIYFVLTKNIYF